VKANSEVDLEVASEEATAVASEEKEEKVDLTATDQRVIDLPDVVLMETSPEVEVVKEEEVVLLAELLAVLLAMPPVVVLLPRPAASDHYQNFEIRDL
jgi:hypothetical protein